MLLGVLKATAMVILAFVGMILLIAFIVYSGVMGDPGPGGEVGVSAGEDRIQILVIPCDSGRLVESVSLLSGVDGPGDDGELIWQVTSSGGASTNLQYEIGETPEGFVETIRAQPIDVQERLVVEVDTDGGLPFRTGFIPADLTQSEWQLSGGNALDRDEIGDFDPCD